MVFAAVGPVAEIAVEAADVDGGEAAEAVLVDALEGDVGGVVADLAPRLDRALDPAEGPALDLRRHTLEVEAVLHLDHDGAAQRVEAEDGVVGHDRDVADGHRGDEVPVDGVPEGLVDPDAVLVNGQALGRARHGRGLEAPEHHVGLKAVAGGFCQSDRGRLLLQCPDDVGRARAYDLVARNEGHRGGDLVDVDTRAGQRRHGGDVDGRQDQWHARPRGARHGRGVDGGRRSGRLRLRRAGHPEESGGHQGRPRQGHRHRTHRRRSPSAAVLFRPVPSGGSKCPPRCAMMRLPRRERRANRARLQAPIRRSRASVAEKQRNVGQARRT